MKTFIQKAIENQVIYTLEDRTNTKNGENGEIFWAECPSAEQNNHNNQAVFCFWHDANHARACQQEEWAHYQLIAIDLNEFISEILLYYHEENFLLGLDFDKNLRGLECKPMVLLGGFLDEIQNQNLINHYPDFDNLKQDYLDNLNNLNNPNQ